MGMRQVGLHMLRNPHRFYKLIRSELIETGESYDSYCWNVFHGNVWGDDVVAAGFGDMWNLAVSVISPAFSKPINLFHNKQQPDIVIVANGGSWLINDDKRCTHFSATRSIDENFKIAGSNLRTTLGSPAKNLIPIKLVSREKAREVAAKDYARQQKLMNLENMREVAKNIDYLNEGVCKLIAEKDRLLDVKESVEYQLQMIGVKNEEIMAVGKVKPAQYCRTWEREDRDKEEERKRKREKEIEDEESRKRVRSVYVDRNTGEKEDITPEEEKQEEVTEEKENEGHFEQVAIQQKKIIDEQQQIVQQLEMQLSNREIKIKLLEEKEKEWDKILRQQEKVAITPDTPSTSTSGTAAKPGSIESVLPPKLLGYFNKLKQEPSSVNPIDESVTEVTDVGAGDQVIEVTETKKQTKVYVHKGKSDTQPDAVLLLEKPDEKTTSLRRGDTNPIAGGLRDPNRYYCDNCKAHYSRKDELSKHKRYNCRKTIRDYICFVCNAGFYEKNSVREHYYKEHDGSYLYRCKKCNMGFHYKSVKSMHTSKGACPNKDEEDKFEARLPFDKELEAKFKRCTVLPIQLPDEVLKVAEEEEQREMTESELKGGKESTPIQGTDPNLQKSAIEDETEEATASSILEGMLSFGKDKTDDDDDKQANMGLDPEEERQFIKEEIESERMQITGITDSSLITIDLDEGEGDSGDN